MERPFLAQRTFTVVQRPVRIRPDRTVAGLCWADVVAGRGGGSVAIAEEEGDGRQQNGQRRDGHGDGHAEVGKERSQQQSSRRRRRAGIERKSSDGIVAMGRSGGIDGRHADDIVPGRNESAEEESLLRRRFRTGDDPFGGIGRAESDDKLLDRTSAVPPSRPSQFQNGRRAGQLIGFFFFIRREEFRRRSFGFGRHQIAGRTVAHSVAGGRQREFVLAAAVQVADWDGPPSGRKDSLSPFVLLGRPTGPEFEDKRSDGRNLFGRPVVSASGHGPLDCDEELDAANRRCGAGGGTTTASK